MTTKERTTIKIVRSRVHALSAKSGGRSGNIANTLGSSGRADKVRASTGANIHALAGTEWPLGKSAKTNTNEPKPTDKTARTIPSNSGTVLTAANVDRLKAA
ncbi:MAG TPA: hypothetical protein VMS99_09515 [Acidimicrobiia bacterium]|nr:hypothetical protein [Acidimicrobiia bacterium]